MTTGVTKQQLETIIQAVVKSAVLCEAVRSDMVSLRNEAMTKTDKSPVTIADYGSQAIICKMLKENFPQDPVVAEEDARDLRLPAMKGQLGKILNYVSTALMNDGDVVQETDVLSWIDHGNGTPVNKRRFWTLDPIDGTKGFLRGD